MATGGDTAFFELRFRPNIQLVSVVRRFVTAFYERVLDDDEVTQRMALATHELLENAVKYASDGETVLRIEVAHTKRPMEVCIQTWNQTTKGNEAIVEATVRASQEANDPFAFYQSLMAKSAVRKDDGSGLGLARIRAEADMSIACEVVEGQVCITARALDVGATGGANELRS